MSQEVMAKFSCGDNESKDESLQLMVSEFSVEEAFANVVNGYLYPGGFLDQHRTNCMLGHSEISEKLFSR